MRETGWVGDLYPACRCSCAKRRRSRERGSTIKHYCLLRRCTRTVFHLGKRDTLEESSCTLDGRGDEFILGKVTGHILTLSPP